MLRIDRRPLPHQVRDRLNDQIQSGALVPGQELPAEHELAGLLGVSRATVREGIKLLEQEGHILARRGRRHVVTAAATVERPITQLESVTEMMQALGYVVVNQVLSVRRRAANDDERGALGLGEAAEVVELQRLRLQDLVPLIVSVDVMPAALGVELVRDGASWDGSLFELFTSQGQAIIRATAQIRATTLPPSLAEATGEDPRQPWLLLTQVHLNDSGEPILYSHDYHSGEHFRFNVVRHRTNEIRG